MNRLTLVPIKRIGGYPIFSEDEPSEIFTDAVTDGGTPVCECELCGRVHFNGSGEYMDEGELEMYQKHAKEDPYKYVERDNQIFHGTLDGLHVVYGCPCNGLAVYEEFIAQNMRFIVRYAKAAAQDALEQAQHDLKQAEELQEAAADL